MPSGGSVSSRTCSTTTARSSRELGAAWKIMLKAWSSGLTVEAWMPAGATSYAASTSAPVGAMSLAPGTCRSPPTAASMLDAVSRSSG